MPQIKILSKKDGFRRCGQEHSGLKVWPDGTFTPAQVEQLKRDPMLVVEIVEDTPVVPAASAPDAPGKRPNVTDTIALVTAAATTGDLEQLALGEDRKTVLDAIAKRRAELEPPPAEKE
ncbi:HI1506-related protein [Geomonas sp. Red32]|uniref:HI1506-related protein n=1 Tax=Geomonas sp. Red32 TaxID=2912856 RepID=UPI00202CBE41|nr:HI1506-related protein [Geomonas sp. Red32]MCM0081782.1 HI1506-related protein [Geomonas sp. Red32]